MSDIKGYILTTHRGFRILDPDKLSCSVKPRWFRSSTISIAAFNKYGRSPAKSIVLPSESSFFLKSWFARLRKICPWL